MSFNPFDPFTQHSKRPQQQARTAGIHRPLSEKEMKALAKAQKKEKRSKVTRFLFNPELGNSFEGIQQSHQMFLRLVANTFLQTGLIDATYPGLHDPKQLKLVTLIQTAYHDLEFTREGMPRVLLFGAFVGSLAVMALSILVFIISIMSIHSTPPKAAAPAPSVAAPAHIRPATPR